MSSMYRRRIRDITHLEGSCPPQQHSIHLPLSPHIASIPPATHTTVHVSHRLPLHSLVTSFHSHSLESQGRLSCLSKPRVLVFMAHLCWLANMQEFGVMVYFTSFLSHSQERTVCCLPYLVSCIVPLSWFIYFILLSVRSDFIYIFFSPVFPVFQCHLFMHCLLSLIKCTEILPFCSFLVI